MKSKYKYPEGTLEDLKYLTFKKERKGAPIHKHEIFMVFNNDDDAYNFYEWWIAEGKQVFITSLEKVIE